MSMRTLVALVIVGVMASGCAPRRRAPSMDYSLSETPEQRQAREAQQAADEARRAEEREARLREAAAREAGAARADVRGTEGWQTLRWGMSSTEVSNEMRALPRVARAFDQDAFAARFEVATWRTSIAKHQATVHCYVLSEQLARVLVELPEIRPAFLFDLLSSKYGEPVQKDAWSALWQTPESVIFAKWSATDGGQVFYTSKVLEADLKTAVDVWTARRAKGL